MTIERDAYRACAQQAKGYIDHLLRPLQHVVESHIPPLALAQKTTTKFEGVCDTAKAVREWIRSLKTRGKRIIKDVRDVAINIQLTRVKMAEVQRECFQIQQTIDIALPLMRALLWTHAQIPTLQTILDPHNISTFKEWYWIVNMKNDMVDTIKKIQDECKEALSGIENISENILKALVTG